MLKHFQPCRNEHFHQPRIRFPLLLRNGPCVDVERRPLLACPGVLAPFSCLRPDGFRAHPFSCFSTQPSSSLSKNLQMRRFPSRGMCRNIPADCPTHKRPVDHLQKMRRFPGIQWMSSLLSSVSMSCRPPQLWSLGLQDDRFLEIRSELEMTFHSAGWMMFKQDLALIPQGA